MKNPSEALTDLIASLLVERTLFLEEDSQKYKAKIAGVWVEIVDPRNTSRTCPSCGHIAKANRPTRDEFLCESCNFSGHADHVAAMNIAFRADVNQPIVSKLFAQAQAASFRAR